MSRLHVVALVIAAQLTLIAAELSPEERAVAYLAREVPRWSSENGCFSCHNNGDGARALYTAARLHYSVPKPALADTTEWLSHPAKWDTNRGNPAFSDKKLARLQFASALLAALEAGAITERRILTTAVEPLLKDQEADGSWQVDVGAPLGSPVTYGAALATLTVRQALIATHDSRFAPAIAKAGRWLDARKPDSVMEAAALLIYSPKRDDCREFLLGAQNSDGGWGPQPHAPTEVFDTALAILSLAHGHAVDRGRAFLIHAQLEPGGWIETTRPTGASSYAQHISTCAWATLALVATHSKR
jgi:hypothetical protein